MLSTGETGTHHAVNIIHNAFTGVPVGDLTSPFLQKIFMLFHLGIVERPQKVLDMVRTRTATMRTNDIGLITLLYSNKTMRARLSKRPGFQQWQTNFEGAYCVRKSLTTPTTNRLIESGCEADDLYNYFSAFTPDGAQQLMETAGAKIITSSHINADNEKGSPVDYISVVFQKAV